MMKMTMFGVALVQVLLLHWAAAETAVNSVNEFSDSTTPPPAVLCPPPQALHLHCKNITVALVGGPAHLICKQLLPKGNALLGSKFTFSGEIGNQSMAQVSADAPAEVPSSEQHFHYAIAKGNVGSKVNSGAAYQHFYVKNLTKSFAGYYTCIFETWNNGRHHQTGTTYLEVVNRRDVRPCYTVGPPNHTWSDCGTADTTLRHLPGQGMIVRSDIRNLGGNDCRRVVKVRFQVNGMETSSLETPRATFHCLYLRKHPTAKSSKYSVTVTTKLRLTEGRPLTFVRVFHFQN